MPQVGYRRGALEVGRTWRSEERAVRRLRLFTFGEHQEDTDSRLLYRAVTSGLGLDAPLNTFLRLELGAADVRSGDELFRRYQVRLTIEIKPGAFFSRRYLEAVLGDETDFANERPATGGTVSFEADLRGGDHLLLSRGAPAGAGSTSTPPGAAARACSRRRSRA